METEGNNALRLAQQIQLELKRAITLVRWRNRTIKCLPIWWICGIALGIFLQDMWFFSLGGILITCLGLYRDANWPML